MHEQNLHRAGISVWPYLAAVAVTALALLVTLSLLLGHLHGQIRSTRSELEGIALITQIQGLITELQKVRGLEQIPNDPAARERLRQTKAAARDRLITLHSDPDAPRYGLGPILEQTTRRLDGLDSSTAQPEVLFTAYTDLVANLHDAALDALAGQRFDAVLMDCQMPGLDGYATTARIREQEGDGPHIPIIAVTASALEGERERCQGAGMDDFIAKPFKLDTLRTTLARWLPAADTQN